MENKTIQRPEKVTVVAQGETSYHVVSFKTTELDKLKKPYSDQGNLGYEFGSLLDGSNFKEYQREKNKLLAEIPLAKYVANSKAYQVMLSTGCQTIVLTSFRLKNGYQTRVAGVVSYNFNDMICEIEGVASPLDLHHNLLLFVLSTNPLYTEKYQESSVLHSLMKKASEMEGKINLMAPPNMQ